MYCLVLLKYLFVSAGVMLTSLLGVRLITTGTGISDKTAGLPTAQPTFAEIKLYDLNWIPYLLKNS